MLEVNASRIEEALLLEAKGAFLAFKKSKNPLLLIVSSLEQALNSLRPKDTLFIVPASEIFRFKESGLDFIESRFVTPLTQEESNQ